MTFLPIVLAIVGCIFVFIAGLIYGIRKSRGERTRLTADIEDKERAIFEIRARKGPDNSEQLSSLQGVINSLTERLEKQSTEIETALASTASTLRKEVSSLGSKDKEWQLKVANQIDKLRMDQLEPLKKDNLSSRIEDVLGPLARTQSIRQVIEKLDIKGLTRNDLPGLLTTLGKETGLTTCVLVDSTGLPIAANKDGINIEVLAGLSASLHQLANRTLKAGQPMPNAFINRDEENQLTVARFVPIGKDLYTILAVMQGGNVGPDVLDPLVPIMQKVLKYEPWTPDSERK